MSDVLMKLAKSIAKQKIKIIDLTQTLQALDAGDPAAAAVRADPTRSGSRRSRTTTSAGRAGTGTTSRWASTPARISTRRCHWVTGKDNATGYTDTIPVQRFVAPAVVIDCSKEAAADEKFLLEPAHIKAWEGKHGASRRAPGC